MCSTGGCEYLSERLTEVALCSKLNGFFMRRTKEGECYDSYVLYYSGPVTADGHWVLKGMLMLYVSTDLLLGNRIAGKFAALQ